MTDEEQTAAAEPSSHHSTWWLLLLCLLLIACVLLSIWQRPIIEGLYFDYQFLYQGSLTNEDENGQLETIEVAIVEWETDRQEIRQSYFLRRGLQWIRLPCRDVYFSHDLKAQRDSAGRFTLQQVWRFGAEPDEWELQNISLRDDQFEITERRPYKDSKAQSK